MNFVFNLNNLPKNCYVGFKDSYRKKLFDEARSLSKGRTALAKRLGIHPRITYKYQNGDYSIPWPKVIGLIEITNENQKNICENILYLKLTGKAFRLNNPKLPMKFSANLAEIAGHIAGDGGLFTYSNGITTVGHYTNKERVLIKSFKAALKKVFGNVIIYEFYDKRKNAIRLTLPSIVGLFLKHFLGDQNGMKKHVPDIILESTPTCKTLFLRSIFDDEGSVNLGANDGGGKSIELISESRNLISGVQKLLLDLGIESKVHQKRNYYRLFITRKNNIKIFSSKIGFEHPLKSSKLIKMLQSYR